LRIYTQLKMKRFHTIPGASSTDVPVSTHEAREYATSLIAASPWAPEDALLKEEFEALLKVARTDRVRLQKADHEERTQAVEDLGIIDRHKVSLAANTLDLLVQMQHGTSLQNINADQLVAMHDAHSGCWGLIVVDRGSVQLRVRSGDVSVLRQATGDILSVLQVREAGASSKKKNQPPNQFLESSGEILQSNRAGEPEAKGTIHVINGLGLIFYAAKQPAPRTLFIISLALLALSFLSVLAGTAQWPITTDPWFEWGHAIVDRVFTGTLGAALVVVVTTVQSLQNRRRSRTPQVLIRWDGSPA